MTKLKELIKRIAKKRGEDFPFPEDIEAFTADFIPNALLKSETLQIAFEISEEEMEELYAEGYAFYEEGKYIQSADTFRWLVLLNPFYMKYWMGLGASQQLLKLYEKALHSYAAAALLDSSSPYPHFYAYECYTHMDEEEEAQKALHLAEQRAHGVKYHALKEEIASLQGESRSCHPSR